MIIRVKVSRAENLSYFGCVAGDIVNIEIEEYVAGVVASEIGNSHIEACKAQAIAARTFAMHYIGDDKCITDQSSTHQAFRASRWDASQYPNANEAAALTAGMVLTHDGKILKTCSYSSSNGGRTTSSQERWGGYRPYLIAQDDPWDAAACAERTAAGKSITKGHGVGMSQYGAAWAANHGIGYREILGFLMSARRSRRTTDPGHHQRQALALAALAHRKRWTALVRRSLTSERMMNRKWQRTRPRPAAC